MLLSPSAGAPKAHQVIAVICPNDAQELFIRDQLFRHYSVQSDAQTFVALTLGGEHISLSALTDETSLVFIQPAQRWLELIANVDGIIAVIDGDIGLAPELQQLWDVASDADLPRLVIAPDTFRTRADFDEIVAIVQRVLEPDALVRYLPIDDDADTDLDADYVGLYDLLSNDIRVYDAEGVTLRMPDHEHLELTNDQREDLVDELAHSVLEDAALENYANGLPLNFTRLREMWNSDDVVSVLPLTAKVGVDLLTQWIDARRTRLDPVVEQSVDEDVSDLDSNTFGIAIDQHVIRLWGNQLAHGALVRVSDNQLVSILGSVPGVCVTNSEVTVGNSFVVPEVSTETHLVLPELLEN